MFAIERTGKKMGSSLVDHLLPVDGQGSFGRTGGTQRFDQPQHPYRRHCCCLSDPSGSLSFFRAEIAVNTIDLNTKASGDTFLLVTMSACIDKLV
jgi:hypothetical protein